MVLWRVATGHTALYVPHCQLPLVSLVFRQTKQNSKPHLHFICLHAWTWLISRPHLGHALVSGHPSTSPIFFVPHSFKVFKSPSVPCQQNIIIQATPTHLHVAPVGGWAGCGASDWRYNPCFSLLQAFQEALRPVLNNRKADLSPPG